MLTQAGSFGSGEKGFLGFSRTGDKGTDGTGAGDVIGPSSATNDAIARYDTTTGKLLQDSSATVDDVGNISANGLTLTNALPVNQGGTGATSASAARTAMSAAASGANSDITSLSGLTTDLDVPQGGTGASTHTQHGVLLGNGTSAITSTAAGTTGQVLTSNGAGAAPTYQTASPGGGPGLDGNGTGEQSVIRTNRDTISGNATLTIPSNSNGMTAGPISITNGSAVVISSNAAWHVVGA